MAADHPKLVRAVVLLAATHTWPLAPELRDSINKCHQMDLPEATRLKHLQHVFFAPGNDASVWLGGWDEEVMHAERDATEATPKPEWWTAGTAPVLDVLSLRDPLSPPDSIYNYRDQWGADRVTIAKIDNAAHDAAAGTTSRRCRCHHRLHEACSAHEAVLVVTLTLRAQGHGVRSRVRAGRTP